ncbi:hypothetical protein MTO96_002435 [Rhipicephalus appendiculatus]
MEDVPVVAAVALVPFSATKAESATGQLLRVFAKLIHDCQRDRHSGTPQKKGSLWRQRAQGDRPLAGTFARHRDIVNKFLRPQKTRESIAQSAYLQPCRSHRVSRSRSRHIEQGSWKARPSANGSLHREHLFSDALLFFYFSASITSGFFLLLVHTRSLRPPGEGQENHLAEEEECAGRRENFIGHLLEHLSTRVSPESPCLHPEETSSASVRHWKQNDRSRLRLLLRELLKKKVTFLRARSKSRGKREPTGEDYIEDDQQSESHQGCRPWWAQVRKVW